MGGAGVYRPCATSRTGWASFLRHNHCLASRPAAMSRAGISARSVRRSTSPRSRWSLAYLFQFRGRTDLANGFPQSVW